MADDDWLHAEIHLEEDEVPLLTLLVTTRGIHAEPGRALGTVGTADQVAIVRDIAAGLRRVADTLEADAGLVEAIDAVGEGMSS